MKIDESSVSLAFGASDAKLRMQNLKPAFYFFFNMNLTSIKNVNAIYFFLRCINQDLVVFLFLIRKISRLTGQGALEPFCLP